MIQRVSLPVARLFEPLPRTLAATRTEHYLLAAILLLATVVRFWGLGSFSLHKPDEDTTVLAAVHILEDGRPQFPSGMFYARAIIQSYLIAGAAWLFGESEWSLRLPSALCGVLLVWLTWLASRRFLTTPWRLALAFCLALLPAAIADSQEARMYSFLVASLTGYLVLVFRWERTGRWSDLAWAVAIMALAIQFQELALFGALAVLFPGLLTGETRRILQGMGAVVAMGLCYLVISGWQGSFYPAPDVSYMPEWSDPLLTAPTLPIAQFQLPLLLTGLVLAAVVTFIAMRRVSSLQRLLLGAGVAAALLLQATWHSHLAGLVWLVVIIGAMRSEKVTPWAWAAAAAAVLVIAALQMMQLLEAGVGPRKALGLLAGRPSPWAYLQASRHSAVAGVVTLLGLAAALIALARGRRVPDVWLFFALTVWVPLVAIGCLAWFLPPRYVQFAMIPLLITAFAVGQHVRWPATLKLAVPAAVLAILSINPLASARAINAGHRFADHRGAANFLKSLAPGPRDIIIAEDVLIHSYYLKRADYWLSSPQVAAPFLIRHGDARVDQYTHARILDSVDDLQELAARPDRGTIYIIGSIEDGDRLYYRGAGLHALLESSSLTRIYEGADGTRIWKIAPGEHLP